MGLPIWITLFANFTTTAIFCELASLFCKLLYRITFSCKLLHAFFAICQPHATQTGIRDGWRLQNGWFFGKQRNPKWPLRCFRFLHYTLGWILSVKKFRVHIVLVCDFILFSLPDSIEKMFSKGSQLVLAKVQNTEDSPPYPRPRLLATGKSPILDGIPPLLGSSWPLLSDYIPIFIHSSPVR